MFLLQQVIRRRCSYAERIAVISVGIMVGSEAARLSSSPAERGEAISRVRSDIAAGSLVSEENAVAVVV